MRRIVAVTLGMLALVALAGPVAARTRPPTAAIDSVEPVYVTTAEDDYGTYCLYRAEITLSWTGSIRLQAGHLVDGHLSAPEEVVLSGSSSGATVIVPEISVRAGDEGPLGAQAIAASSSGKKSATVLSKAASAQTLTCPATG